MLTEREAAIQLNNIIEQKVKEILKERDYTIYCEVKAVGENGRLDLVPLDSENQDNTLANKINNSPFSFKSGDVALLYVPKGQLSSSFVVAKMNISQTELSNYLNSDILTQIKNAISQANISGSGQVGPQGPQGPQGPKVLRDLPDHKDLLGRKDRKGYKDLPALEGKLT